MSDFSIGVDIGGTKVAAGLVDAHGEIRNRTRKPMVARGTAAEGLAAVISAIEALLDADSADRSALRGIGVCSPGPLDPQKGVVLNPPNLPCWRNFPLADELRRAFRVPVWLDNDANAAGLAEVLWGAGRGYRNVFYATIGTGIGTGIIFDGHIYHGRTGAAAEGGHLSIDYHGPRCACGKHGCIEALAAGPAIAERARQKLAGDPSRHSQILALAGDDTAAVTSEIVGQAYAAGDAVATQVLEETVDLLAIWLGNVIDLLEPDVIIIGGGVSAMLTPFFPRIRGHLPECCINPWPQDIPIVVARYAEDSGIAGAAALCTANDSALKAIE
ncbi:MAG: ROK family protein [Candidatus Acidiferrales bacterium]